MRWSDDDGGWESAEGEGEAEDDNGDHLPHQDHGHNDDLPQSSGDEHGESLEKGGGVGENVEKL